jgi:protein TonB
MAGFSISCGAHAIVFGALLAGGFLAVGSIQRPPVRLSSPDPLFLYLRPAAAIAVAAPLGSSRPAERRERKPPDEPLPEMIQPEAIPDEPPAEEPALEENEGEFDDEGIPDGHDEGIQGGIPNGDPRGVLNGDPNGIVDGLKGAPPGGKGPIQGLPEEVVYLTGEVAPPVKIHDVRPDYPEAARRARLEGRVILNLVIGRDGEVEAVEVVSGTVLFRKAAVEAARRWRYRPAMQAGSPVRISMLVHVEFKLR